MKSRRVRRGGVATIIEAPHRGSSGGSRHGGNQFAIIPDVVGGLQHGGSRRVRRVRRGGFQGGPSMRGVGGSRKCIRGGGDMRLAVCGGPMGDPNCGGWR